MGECMRVRLAWWSARSASVVMTGELFAMLVWGRLTLCYSVVVSLCGDRQCACCWRGSISAAVAATQGVIERIVANSSPREENVRDRRDGCELNTTHKLKQMNELLRRL